MLHYHFLFYQDATANTVVIVFEPIILFVSSFYRGETRLEEIAWLVSSINEDYFVLRVDYWKPSVRYEREFAFLNKKKKKRRKEEAFLQNQEETSIRFAYRILANYTDVQPIFSSHGLMKCEDNPIPIYMYIHIIYMYVYTYYIIYAHAKHKILRLSIYNHVITRAHVRMSSYT